MKLEEYDFKVIINADKLNMVVSLLKSHSVDDSVIFSSFKDDMCVVTIKTKTTRLRMKKELEKIFKGV